jgi:hypothetical protein
MIIRGFIESAGRAFLVALLMGFAVSAHAQSPLLNELHTIAAVSQPVPAEHSFDVTLAGKYTITLADVGATQQPTPLPLTAVSLAVTSNGQLVGKPLTAAGSLTIDATVGTYVVHVVGILGAAGSGDIGIQVTDSTGAVVSTFSDSLAPPPITLPPNEAALNDSFTVSTDGTYTVTLTDLSLPQPLTTLTAIITTDTGQIITNPPLTAAGTLSVSLQHGVNYRIFAAGLADSTVNAGLFSANVVASSDGTIAYSRVVSVGQSPAPASVTLMPGSYTLTLTDLKLPAALTTAVGLVVANGLPVTRLNAPGTSAAFTAVAATYQVYVAATTPNSGSYALSLGVAGSAPALTTARIVTAAGATGATGYAFDVPPVQTAGNYSFTTTDFAFPTRVVSLGGAVVQNGAAVGTPLTAPGTQTVPLVAGPATLLIFVQPGTSGSLFGTTLTTSDGSSSLFETTQGVGDLFSVRQVAVTTAASYAVNVADLGFPASLGSLAVIVTRGSTQVGAIFGGGAFAFDATPGNYLVNFVAVPGTSQQPPDYQAGTYSLNITTGPSAKLQADSTSIANGGIVKLTWKSQNATACTASGGWTGTQLLNGSFTSPALTQNTTFTLTCTGNGVNAVSTVNVTVASAPSGGSSSGGGGGGSLDLTTLLLLGVAALIASQRVRRGSIL